MQSNDITKLFDQTEYDAWRKRYWAQKQANPDDVSKWSEKINSASVQTVMKKRDPQAEIQDFFQAQHDLAKNTLPHQCKGDGRLDLFSQQLHRTEDFVNNTFSGYAGSPTVYSGRTYYAKCGHYVTLKAPQEPDDRVAQAKAKDDYCFACKVATANKDLNLNQKPDFVSFKKKDDEMTPTPSQAFDLIYPMPFGKTIPQSAAQKPTTSAASKNAAKEALTLMQKDNTIEWIGSKYLPKETQDGKNDTLPPQFQLSSAKSAPLGCLMAMVPSTAAHRFVDFGSQFVDKDTLAENGIEDEPHVTVLYGFIPNFDPEHLNKMLASTGPVPFTVSEIGRFECPAHDVLHFKVYSPELEMLNSKICKAFAGEIEQSNYRYHPHLTLAYVKKGTNTHLDGIKIRPMTYGTAKLLYSGPHKRNRQYISLSWDAQKFTDLDFQDGIGDKTKNKPQQFEQNLGDMLQDHLIKKSQFRQEEKNKLIAQLKK